MGRMILSFGACRSARSRGRECAREPEGHQQKSNRKDPECKPTRRHSHRSPGHVDSRSLRRTMNSSSVVRLPSALVSTSSTFHPASDSNSFVEHRWNALSSSSRERPFSVTATTRAPEAARISIFSATVVDRRIALGQQRPTLSRSSGTSRLLRSAALRPLAESGSSITSHCRKESVSGMGSGSARTITGVLTTKAYAAAKTPVCRTDLMITHSVRCSRRPRVDS